MPGTRDIQTGAEATTEVVQSPERGAPGPGAVLAARSQKDVIDRVTLLDEFQVGDPTKGNYSGKVEAIGAVRMIQDAIALDPAAAALAATTNTTPDPDHPTTMRTVKDEVDVLALPARMSLPSTAPAGTDSLQTWCADPANRKRIDKLSLDRLLAFISTQNLTHYTGQNWAPFAAHELFVAEIAEELYN